MHVYIVQHGKPVPKEENPERPLSTRGKDDVERVAAFLHRAGVRVGAVYHSGKPRAEQTAEILADRIGAGGMALKREGLAPLDDVSEIAQFINEFGEELMIVGHLPHLSKLISRLIHEKEVPETVAFKQGGVCCLTQNDMGGWSIAWVIIPQII
jgi:phosphohistidine phosphatase